jgi:hypothetical protein
MLYKMFKQNISSFSDDESSIYKSKTILLKGKIFLSSKFLDKDTSSVVLDFLYGSKNYWKQKFHIIIDEMNLNIKSYNDFRIKNMPFHGLLYYENYFVSRKLHKLLPCSKCVLQYCIDHCYDIECKSTYNGNCLNNCRYCGYNDHGCDCLNNCRYCGCYDHGCDCDN